eukprot:scaffold263659_cov17-Tisochrysis_lutea.AAC.2
MLLWMPLLGPGPGSGLFRGLRSQPADPQACRWADGFTYFQLLCHFQFMFQQWCDVHHELR